MNQLVDSIKKILIRKMMRPISSNFKEPEELIEMIMKPDYNSELLILCHDIRQAKLHGRIWIPHFLFRFLILGFM